MTVDVRVNGTPWKEFKNAAHASNALGCGHFDNGDFDISENEMAEHFLRVRTGENLDDIHGMAKAFLADNNIDFSVVWVDEKNW